MSARKTFGNTPRGCLHRVLGEAGVARYGLHLPVTQHLVDHRRVLFQHQRTGRKPTLLTEDLKAGRRIGSLIIVNPFALEA